MTKRKILTEIIKFNGDCTAAKISCDKTCPFLADKYDCLPDSNVYQFALKRYLRLYGKESLVEILI